MLADSIATGNDPREKYLVLFRDRAIDEGIKMLRNLAGVSRVARAADFQGSAAKMAELADAEILVFDCLGGAALDIEPKQLQSLRVGRGSPILTIEPEKILTAIDDETIFDFGKNPQELSDYIAEKYPDDLVEWEGTWGLEATNVLRSRFSGSGIKIAVLDTGLDLEHPDFNGRQIVSQSFVPEEAVQDGNGHGTHCIGTACGSLFPEILPRYGIAYCAKIYAGKVLENRGRGFTRQILAGMEWAIANNCQIISMSLGRPTTPGEPYSPTYETLARRSLQRGTLIVAAAGNNSKRHLGIFNPVSHPANCPSILAVGAIDSQLRVARFSNRGINPIGGRVDIAAPGVDVFSSYPMPQKYRRLRGTSMATPHVAGIAALYAEATGCTGADLWQLLVSNARPLPLPAADVGSGMVRAPG